ncbi:TA2R7 protein, partial [Smithornis capensis]|nr:TA2R7 protein [Smithornis capensis]NXF14118.1 TA2R7 protein [Smithornis capensis]
SPEQVNVTSYSDTTAAIIILEVFSGMWINVFIITVLCMGWFKKKLLNSNEKILMLLGCCRFWYMWVAWIYFLLLVIYPNYLYVDPIYQLVISLQKLLNYLDFLVSACLCVFYCVKIANFRSSFFIYLKVKMDRIVPWLLLGSVLFSLVTGILVYDITDKALCNNLSSTCQGCFWKAGIRREEHFLPIFVISGFVFVTSFTAVIVSAILLLFSLWRHKRNMQTNSMKDLSMDAHIRAMKSILSFFIMYSINFIFSIMSVIYSMKNENHVKSLLAVFLYAFPGVHSLTLIFSNPKLEKAILKILQCVKRKFCMR